MGKGGIMGFTIIDDKKPVKEEKKPSKKGSFSIVEEAPQNTVAKAARGTAQGVTDLLNLVDLAQAAVQSPLTYALLDKEQRKEVATPGMKAEAELLTNPDISDVDFAALAASGDDLLGLPILPGQRTEARKRAAEIPEGGLLQEGIRRGVRSAPFGTAGLISEFTGLGAKELVKLAGGGEFLQTAADITAGLASPFAYSKLSGAGSKAVSAAEKLPSAVEEVGTKFAKAEINGTANIDEEIGSPSYGFPYVIDFEVEEV